MSQIEDPNVASALLFKVNVFNAETTIKSAATVITFAALPKTAAIIVCFLSIIYALEGRVPEEV